MPQSKTLPARPNLEHLKKQAKERLALMRRTNRAAKLASAQLAVAREYGFASWRALHERIQSARAGNIAVIAQLFARFAELECRGRSPLYERLSLGIANDPDLLDLASHGRAPIPNLFLAAVHFLLLRDPSAGLARFYPSINPDVEIPGDVLPVFKSFCLERKPQIVQLMRTRLVQTNEVARSGFLLPAFTLAAQLAGRPLALVEIGTSAGINLSFDQYAHDYGPGLGVHGNPRSPLRLKYELRGEIAPPLPTVPLPIAQRIGIDLNPIRTTDADGISWLEALIWPEHRDRLANLRSALAIADRVPRELIEGDAARIIGQVLRGIPDDQTPCVFQTNTLNQFPADTRARFFAALDRIGASRELLFISRHDTLTIDHYHSGNKVSLPLAECDAHGKWIEWKLPGHARAELDTTSADTERIGEFFKAISTGDTPRALEILSDHPDLVRETAAHPMWGGQPQALHVAIESGREEIVNAILDAGADVNGRNDRYDGWSPLMLSVHWKRPAMTQALLRRGASIDLISALMLEDDDRVEKLSKDDRSLTGPFPNGATPLHFARTAKAAKLLLDAGVDPVMPEKRGTTPAASAAARGRAGKAILTLLRKRGAQLEPWMLAATDDLAGLKSAIASAPALTADPAVLFAAVEHGRTTTVAWLLDHGADPNVRHPGKSKQTPLHSAAWSGKLDLVKLLLGRGANPKAIDEEHRTTPLIWARTALERLNRVECQTVIDHLEALETSKGKLDPEEFARKAVRRMERGWAESCALIEQRFADAGDAPRWEALGIHSPTLTEREADAAIARCNVLGQFCMISIWHAAKIEPSRRAILDFPPTRSVEFFRNGDVATRPAGGSWRRIDWQPTRTGFTGRPGRSDDLVEALKFLAERAPAGEFRVITVRRMLFAKKVKGRLKVIKKHGSHSMACMSPVDPAAKAKKEWSVESLPAHRKSHKIVQWKPIMDAAFAGDDAQIIKLLDAGADPNVISTTPHRYRPLHRAIEHKKTAAKHEGHERAVRALLDGGADPTLRATFTRVTALQLAAIDEPRFVPLLVDRFRPLDLFHAIVLLDQSRVAELLKSDRSLAKARDENGWSTLHYAAASAMYRSSDRAAQAQLEIVRKLIAAGADPAATFPWPGQHQWPMPVMYYSAGLHNNPAVTRLLMEAGAMPFDNESVYHAADERHQECLDLFERMCDRKKLAAECTRCLASQFHWGHTAGVKWLLEHGADPNAVHPWYGQSALHIAISRDFSEKILDLLFAHGADVRIKANDGKTGLELAKKAGAKVLARVKATMTSKR